MIDRLLYLCRVMALFIVKFIKRKVSSRSEIKQKKDGYFGLFQFAEFPMCMSYGQDQLWVGDKTGSLHLVDATDGLFNLIQVYTALWSILSPSAH